MADPPREGPAFGEPTPEEEARRAREAAGYDRDLGGLTDALTLATAVAGILDFGLLGAATWALVFAPFEWAERTALGRTLPGGFALDLARDHGFWLVLVLSVLVGSLVADADRRRRAAGVPGSRVPARAFGPFSGILARGGARRRMRLQDREPLTGREPDLARALLAEREAPVRGWAREILAGTPSAPLALGAEVDAETAAARERLVAARGEVVRALAALGEARGAGFEPRRDALLALRGACVASEASRAEDRAATEGLWPERGRLEEPLRLGSPRR